jgi:hypothetical protein
LVFAADLHRNQIRKGSNIAKKPEVRLCRWYSLGSAVGSPNEGTTTGLANPPEQNLPNGDQRNLANTQRGTNSAGTANSVGSGGKPMNATTMPKKTPRIVRPTGR